MEPTTPAGGVIETDAVVIGAGPVGLFQVFELGLLEIRAHVIDTLAVAGGQCVELYADKPIYDIPGVPLCTGRELVANLLQQIEPFGAVFHFNQRVDAVQRRDDGRFDIRTDAGTRLSATAVFVAGGVGSFQPRLLKVDGIDRFAGRQLHYHVDDPAALAGQRVVIVGGGDAALDWARHFADAQPASGRAASVTLIHRRDAFQATAASIDALRALRADGRVEFIAGQINGHDEDDGRLARLHVACSDGSAQTVAVDALLVFFGLSPKLGPIADWGLALERKQLVVDTEMFQTNVPGIFAVGDIASYPGKKKLILSGFHEAALAAFGAAPLVHPERPVQLQYTTTSPKLHRLLGVESTPGD